jgi:hypothetical protein
MKRMIGKMAAVWAIGAAMLMGANEAVAQPSPPPFQLLDAMSMTCNPHLWPLCMTPDATPAFTQRYPFVINTTYVHDKITAAATAGAWYVVWDTEWDIVKLWSANGATDAEIDQSKDGLLALYNASKAVNPNVQIGFYLGTVPGDFWATNCIHNGGSDCPTEYQAWLTQYDRLNLKLVTDPNEHYEPDPFALRCDFVVIQEYAFYGPVPGDTTGPTWEQRRIDDFTRSMVGDWTDPTAPIYGTLDMARYLGSLNPPSPFTSPPPAHDKPTFIVAWPWFFDVCDWSGKALSCPYMSAIMTAARQKAEGAVIWGGWNVSRDVVEEGYNTGFGLPSSWAGVTGTLAVRIGGSNLPSFTVTFPSGIATMDDVAKALETAINAAVDQHNAAVILPDGTYNPSQPFYICHMSVKFQSTGQPNGFFRFLPDRTAGAQWNIPPSLGGPPDSPNARHWFGIVDGTLSGKIGTFDWNRVVWTDQDQCEWQDGWAQGTGWLNAIIGSCP